MAALHEAEFAEGHGFTPERPAPDGQGWVLPALGYPEQAPLRVHPLHLVGDEDRLAWQLYCEWRGGGMAAGALPEAGGTLDQACCTMASFAWLGHVERLLKPER